MLFACKLSDRNFVNKLQQLKFTSSEDAWFAWIAALPNCWIAIEEPDSLLFFPLSLSYTIHEHRTKIFFYDKSATKSIWSLLVDNFCRLVLVFHGNGENLKDICIRSTTLPKKICLAKGIFTLKFQWQKIKSPIFLRVSISKLYFTIPPLMRHSSR